MKSDEREKGKPARQPGARRARSSKPRSVHGISPSRASSLSIQPQDVSLTRMLETLKPHDHLCLIYDSPEEWRACVVPFISIGLKHGEKCCYFADAHTAEQLHGYLQAEGVDVASTEASGQLVILCESEAYTKEGSFDPDLMISLLITETEKAIAEGYPALRLTGEMTWVLHGLPGSERLLEYEAKLNRDFYPKYPALGICQYDRWKFDPEIIKGVIMTHPLLVRSNHIYHNFYYVPPEEFLNRKRAELEVQHWLNNVEREQRIMDTLRESEWQWATTFDAISDSVCLIDPNGRILRHNYTMERLLGKPASEVDGRFCFELMHGSSQPIAGCPIVRMKQTNHRESMNLQVGDRWLEVTVDPIHDNDGRLVAGVHIMADITERKRMEESLRLSEQNFRDSIENSPLGIRIANEGGKTLYANRALLDIYGYSSVEELEAVPRNQRYTPESYAKHQERKEKRKRGDFVPANYEVSIVRKDGEVRHLDVSRAEVLWNGEKQFQMVYQDITGHKVREMEYQTIIRTAIDGFWLADMQGHFLDVNEAYCHLTGYSRDELLNMAIPDVEAIEKPEETAKRIRKIKEVGYDRFETRHRRKDGEIIDVGISVNYLPIDGGRMFVFIRDITERKKAEQALRESEERYRTLFETNIDGLCVIDETMKILLVNEAAARIFGFDSVEEALEVNPFDFIPPQERERVLENITKGMFENDLKRVNEFRLLNNAGKEVWISAVGAVIVYQDKPAGLISFRDVTQHKLMENLLKESEEKYRLLVENAGQAVSVIQDGMIKFGNPKLAEITGFLMEELTSMSAAQLVHPDDRERVLGYRSGRLKGEVVPNIYHLRIIDKKGNIKWVERNVSLITWESKPAALVLDTDITERKRIEEALRESEEQLRVSLENAPDGIYMNDLEGNFLYGNRKCEEIIGYKREELIGKNFLELNILPENSLARAAELLQANIEGKSTGPDELELIRKDGQRVPIEVNTSVVQRYGQTVVLAFVRDITERKQAEEILKASEARYRNLVEQAWDAIFVVDASGKILLMNQQACRMLGYTEEELLQLNIADTYPVEQRGVAAKRIVMAQRGQPLRYDRLMLRKDGTTIPVEVNIGMLPNGLLQGIVRDITERKQAEETLRQSEEKYRTILSEMQDSYFEVDLAGNLTFFNDSTSNSLGYSAEELMGMSYREFTASEYIKLVYKAFNKVYRTSRPNKGFLWKIVRKDGTVGFVEATVSPLRNPKGEIIGFRGVGRDIIERKRAEEERRQLEQKAQVTSRLASVGEMAAGVAHEINNPLTGVIGYAQLLMDGKDIPSDIRRDLAAINEGAQRVASIVKRLLVFSRQTKPERRDVDINELIESTLALRAYHLRVNNIKVTIQLAPDLPETMADPGQLQQVVLNLVVNAETEMKLARGKGKLLIKTEKVDNTIRISFKDNGPGIAKKNLERIFDPFFTTREVGQGTGLGLSLCHGIVAEHKGKIYAESKLGKGATFIMELPVVTEAEQPKPSEPVVEEPEKVAKARILVVDDEQVIRDLVKRVLAGEGYEVETVDNAGDALEKIEGKRYNLVLIDIKMPGMDGVELYKRIQKIAKSLARRVVFITGDILGAHTEKFLSETKVAHIDKPFSAEQLKREVNRALTGGQ